MKRCFNVIAFNFALEHTIFKVPENQVELKLNGTHHLLVYGDQVNLLGDNIDTIKKNTETFIDADKEVVNAEKTICCRLVTRMQGKIMSLR
jgi:hypothetical protein